MMAAGEKVITVNVDKCIGCRACQVACHVWNNTPAIVTGFSPSFTDPEDLTPHTWMIMKYKEIPSGDSVVWAIKKHQCMHCSNAPCAHACPVGAIEVHPSGAVVIREEKCIGCRYCIEACPYDIPRFDPIKNKVYKCTFCVDRIQNGLAPACVAACPTGTLQFGDYDELVGKYKKEGYEVYGDNVNDYVGHTHYVYVTKRWKGKLKEYFDLPADPRRPVIDFNNKVVKPLGWGLTGLTLAALAAHFVFWRAKRVEEKKEKGGEQ